MMHIHADCFLLLSFACSVACQRGRAQYDTNVTSQLLASNQLDFRGFNFTNLSAGNSFDFNPSSETWQLQLNYSVEPLSQYGDSRNTTLNSYAMIFPEEQLPSQNQTTWTLCTYIWTSMFPDNITSIPTPSDTASGDCTPYLGEACAADFAQAFSDAALLATCPRPPLWSAIPSCVARLGRLAKNNVVFYDVMNWLEPGVQNSNGTYFNTSTRELLSDPKIEGLRSGQVITKLGPSLDAIKNVTKQREEASALQFMALTLSPSKEWIQNQSSITGVPWKQLADIRLVCGRANASDNGTATAAPTSQNIGAGSKPRSIFDASVALLFVLCYNLV